MIVNCDVQFCNIYDFFYNKTLVRVSCKILWFITGEIDSLNLTNMAYKCWEFSH